MNGNDLRTCIDQRRTDLFIMRDSEVAKGAGIAVTPTLIIGGQKIDGWRRDETELALRNALAEGRR